MTGSKLQLYNGFALLGTFFGARLCWGTYSSVRVFQDIYRAIQAGGLVTGTGVLGLGKGAAPNGTAIEPSAQPAIETMRFAAGTEVPVWLAGTYLAANVILNTLNYFWFNKMIATVRKRFEPPLGTKRPEKKMRDEDKVFVEGIDVETDEEVEVTGIASNGDAQVRVGDETVIARGLYDDGRRTVEVQKTQVRNRRRG